MEYKKYVTIKEAAYILGVSPLTLRNWDKNGKFPAQRHPMNNYRVYKTDSLLRIIEDIETGGQSQSNMRKRMKKLTVVHLHDDQ
jgi:DNA-binding transcriptional MerR regulator